MLTRAWNHFAGWLERLIVTRLVPKRVGPVMRLVFKGPILFYRLGLGPLLSKKIILLETKGRRSGRIRLTPIEYGYNEQTGAYFLMSGWRGKSDWYRNARACPRVRLWVGNRRLNARAVPATNEEVVQELEKALMVYPQAAKTWTGYSGIQYDGSRSSLQQIARCFPSLWVVPERES